MATPRKPADRKKPQTSVQKRVRKEAAKRPAQRAAAAMKQDQKPDKPVSSAQQWKKSAEGFELEVPSGNVALVRRPGMQLFLDSGIIPNSLMKIVKEKMGEEEPTEFNMEDFDQDQLLDMFSVYDNVTVFCVVQPEVHPVPKMMQENGDGDLEEITVPLSMREQGKLYVDEVDIDDKMFIFQWAVGGTRDLESFRQQKDESIQRLSQG